MPRDGAIVFSDLIGKLDLLRVACDKCVRDGSYGLSRLIAKRGRAGKAASRAAAQAAALNFSTHTACACGARIEKLAMMAGLVSMSMNNRRGAYPPKERPLTRALKRRGVYGCSNIFCPHSSNVENHPAMAVGVTDKLLEMSDMVAILENWESVRAIGAGTNG